jgi:hypothetical protein
VPNFRDLIGGESSTVFESKHFFKSGLILQGVFRGWASFFKYTEIGWIYKKKSGQKRSPTHQKRKVRLDTLFTDHVPTGFADLCPK